jgi:hypothetical protein
MSERINAWLFAPQRDWLAPVLRVMLILMLLPSRFVGADDRLARAFRAHPRELIDAPHVETVLRLVDSWPPSRGLVDAVDVVLIVAGICAALGLFTRAALLVCVVFLTFEFGVLGGLGFFNHTPALPAQLLFALAVLPGTTAWSLDRVLLWRWRRYRGGTDAFVDVVHPPVPRFGELGLLLVVGLLYFASGFAKVRLGLWGWVNGETLTFYLNGGTQSVQEWYGPVAHSLGTHGGAPVVDGYLYMSVTNAFARALTTPILVLPLSWGAVLFELLMLPLLLLGSLRVRAVAVAAAVAFHVVVLVTIGPNFVPWLLVDLCLLVPMFPAWRDRRSAKALQEAPEHRDDGALHGGQQEARPAEQDHQQQQ